MLVTRARAPIRADGADQLGRQRDRLCGGAGREERGSVRDRQLEPGRQARARSRGSVSTSGINYTTQDVVEEVMKATDGARGRHRLRARRRRAVPEGARLARQGRAPRDLRRVTPGRSSRSTSSRSSGASSRVIGSFVFGRSEVETCFALIARGTFKPQIAATFPLEQVKEATELMESREFFGKIVLTTEGEEMKRVGVDVGGTFTDLIYVDDEAGVIRVHKLATTPEDPSLGTIQGVREIGGRGRRRPVGARSGVPRDDDRDEHRDRAQRCDGGDDHDGGLPGHPPHRETQEATQLLQLPGSPLAALPGRSAALSADGSRADHGGRLRARPARRGARHASRSAASRTSGVEAVCVCFLFSFLNPAHEQRVAEIVREEFPEAFVSVSSEVIPQYREYERFSTVGLNAYVGPKVASYVGAPPGGARGPRGAHGAPPDDLGFRGCDSRGGDQAAGDAAHVRAGGGSRRRNLGRSAGRVRQRDHARRRRNVGRHRPRPGRASAHEAPARHEGRAVPGDDPDGRRGHDRRRRRLDRVRRRRRNLPRRATFGRRRPGSGRVRSGWHRGDRDRCDGQPGLAPSRGVPRRRDVARPGGGAQGLRGRPGRRSRNERRGGIDGCRADPLALDGAVDRGELGAQGLRPARLRARCRGRRRPALRGADRGRGRDAERRRPALPGDRGGNGTRCDGHGLRVCGDDVPATLEARCRRSAAAIRGARSAGRRASSQRTASPPTASSCSGSSTPATSVRGTSFGWTSARVDRRKPGSTRFGATSTTSTSASTRGGSRTPTSRFRTSACAASA